MALLDNIREQFNVPKEYAIPTGVKERLRRGREEMLRDATKRRLCMRFERGESYWYLNKKLALMAQGTAFDSPGKKQYRIRNSYNFLRPIVDGKVSAATARIPGYEVLPTGTEPERVAAAKMAEQVAAYGYDKWRLRNVSIQVIKLAIAGGGEGFALPYFDPNVGPYHSVQGQNGDGPSQVGEGEIKVQYFNGNEVYWEPGVEFDDSRWWATEQAVPIDVVIEYEGYIGGKLAPDASGSDISNDRQGTSNLVMVVDYYERPSPKNPRGRKIRIANGRQITAQEDYPLIDHKGDVLDEPLLHRLIYTHDVDGKRDLGLIWQLIDFQRTAQDCYNKLLEYKNRGMNARMMSPIGGLLKRPDDEPGGIDWYRPVMNQTPQYEPPVRIPPELFKILEQAQTDMRSVAADEQIEAAPNVAAQSIQQVIDTSRARWGAFLGDVAEWHSRLMRHCLLLVSRHYTEERDLQIRGRYGEGINVQDFLGSDILDQVNVRVNPGTLQVRTRAEINQQVMAFAQNGWITPQQAMAAINTGQGAEKFVERYELDIGKINRIIQKIRDGTVMQMPARAQDDPTTNQPMIDPQTGEPQEIPGWMPDVQDDLTVWKDVLSDWMKTDEYEKLEPGMQEVARNMFGGIEALEAQKAQRAAMMQEQQAQSLGMGNAAKPQGPPPLPSMSNPQPGQPAQGPQPGGGQVQG